jgi:hypothetical protein
MFIGPRDPVEAPLIEGLGFTVVNRIKVLGFFLDNAGCNLEETYNLITNKVRMLIVKWTKFNLSLAGRIAISKTFLVSQVTYPGAILTPTTDKMAAIQLEINNFVLKGMPFAKDRLYLSTEKGGLGLLCLQDLISALQCSWFKRIFQDGINDNWRMSLLIDCFLDIQCFRPSFLDRELRPLEYSIGTSFWNYCKKFWAEGNNFLQAPLINNDFFFRGRDIDGRIDTRPVSDSLIGRDCFELNKKFWLMVKLNFFIDRGQPLGYEETNNKLGFRITFNVYLYIRKAVCFAMVKHAKIAHCESRSIVNMLARTAKGSKKFRLVISMASTKTTKGVNSIRTLGQLLNVELPMDSEGAGRLLGLWNRYYWPVDTRQFIFQLYNNSLPVGSRLFNRYRQEQNIEIDERCNLCFTGYNVPHRETFQHIYFECLKTGELFTRYIDAVRPDPDPDLVRPDPDPLAAKQKIFTHTDEDGQFNEIVAIGNLLFLQELWTAKLRHKAPGFLLNTVRTRSDLNRALNTRLNMDVAVKDELLDYSDDDGRYNDYQDEVFIVDDAVDDSLLDADDASDDENAGGQRAVAAGSNCKAASNSRAYTAVKAARKAASCARILNPTPTCTEKTSTGNLQAH